MDIGVIAMIADEATKATQTPGGIVGILQVLVLPVVLVATPIILKRSKRREARQKIVAEHIGETNGHGTIAAMSEQTLIAIGEMRSDIKTFGQRLEDHTRDDREFQAGTDHRLERIEKAVCK